MPNHPRATTAIAALVAIAVLVLTAAGVAWLTWRPGSGTDTPATAAAEMAGAEGFAFEPNATVVSVVDGDTLVVDIGGAQERVRLIGIDSPESVRPNHPVECYGPEASDRMKQLAPEGTQLYMERDIEPRDQYGRLLVYVYRAEDGLHLNAEQVAQGYAEAYRYPPNTALQVELAAAERAARSNGAGLWSAC